MATQNSIITHFRRKSLARVTSGAQGAISKIKYVALGDGGVDEDGNPIVPGEMQTGLRNEVARYLVAEPEFPVETTARYTIVVPEEDLIGVAISEMALLDEDGMACAIRTTTSKIKDSDEEFSFVFDDEF